MNLEQFSPKAPGHLVGTIENAKAFVPAPLPPEIDFASIFKEYGAAMAAIGMLNAKMAQLSNPGLIIRPLQRREALLSSAMEGTFTTSDELALLEAGAEGAGKADTREVLNYVKALTHSVGLMKQLPICHRLIREAHEKLLTGLSNQRGGHKRPGEYKKEQNWIGGPTPAKARFVPPPPSETMKAMDDLEAFINRESPESIPPLIEAALVHYQFETIHPFADGNGRVGRILIPLILLARGLISEPVFYPSASLESRKDMYIDRMFDVSATGDWTGWLRFFLKACEDTCISSAEVVDRMLGLQAEYRERAMKEFRSNNVIILIDHLFSSPAVSTPIVQNLLGVTHRAARMTIANLEKIGILEKMDGFSMPEFFVAKGVLRAGS